MLIDAVPLLRQYLQQLANRGIKWIEIQPEAKERLRHLGDGKRVPTPPEGAVPLTGGSEVRDSGIKEIDEASLIPSGATARPSSSAQVLRDIPGATREEKLAHLASLAETGEAARSLGTLRDTMVFAVGNPHADIMFIGEAPGAEEERQREPFVGPAGQLLTKIIKAMGLDRTDVYISNICKFRPAMENQGNGNRQPTAREMESCLPFILTEIDIIRPKVIIALGATACAGLGIGGTVGRNRGRAHAIHDIPVIVTYHPSYLLRQEKESAAGGLTAKRQCWEDLLLAMEIAELPITEKQRGFFKTRS